MWGAVLLVSTDACLIYNEDLLLDGEGGGGAGGSAAGGGGAGGSEVNAHLLISEIVVGPNNAEMVEIFNPTDAGITLDDVYLADFADYHQSGASPGDTDFKVRFPTGATIEAGGRQVVALKAASDFEDAFGQTPDYDLPNMGGTFTTASGLANGDEMLVLFQWDGSGLVKDLDYVVWGDTSDAADKTGVQSYADDTPADQQVAATAPPTNSGLHRCNNDEPGETKMGGNGINGHDETSEDLRAAFASGTPTPKASPPTGTCP